MHLHPFRYRYLFPWLLAALLIACTSAPPAESPRVFIVRHAEKTAGPDPALTTGGMRRAEALAVRLAEEGVSRIFSTDTRRTRLTAAPLAARLGIETEIHDHREQAQLVERIRAAKETVLVVGHSNTIGELAAAFGVNPGEPVNEATEHDRLYVITLAPSGVRGEIRRYGAKPETAGETSKAGGGT